MIKYLIAAIFALSLVSGATAQTSSITTSASIGLAISSGSNTHHTKYKYSKHHKNYKKKKKKRKDRDKCESYGQKQWMSGGSTKSKYWKNGGGTKDCDPGDDGKPTTP